MGLGQKKLAAQLGVDTTTVSNWERNVTTPALHLWPRIIDFLGYTPIEDDPNAPIGERIRTYRHLHGLTQKALATVLGVEEGTIRTWEHGRNQPRRNGRRRVEEVIRRRD